MFFADLYLIYLYKKVPVGGVARSGPPFSDTLSTITLWPELSRELYIKKQNSSEKLYYVHYLHHYQVWGDDKGR